MSSKLRIFFFILSLALIYFAYSQYYKSEQLLAHGNRTVATVIEMVTVYDSDGSDTYKPVFEYQTEDGGNVIYTSNVSSSPPSYHTGQKVNIVYDPATTDFKVISFWGLYRWTFFLLLFGLPLFIIGVWPYLKRRKENLSFNQTRSAGSDQIKTTDHHSNEHKYHK